MARANKRSTRLIELAEHLVSRRRPVKVAELTEHFGINRATIYRMLTELEAELDTPVQRSADGVWINPDDYQMSVRLNLNEALVVFLAARLLARYSDKPNPHAVRALNKLSIALKQAAPRIAEHIAHTSEKLDRPLTERAMDHLQALEELTRAWAAGTRVRLFTRDEPGVERLFEPYFIEPSAVGYSSYVIGYDHLRHDERTFKIERLHCVLPTLDTFTIPATFDPYARLAGAWGVNWGKGEPVDVVLRFAAGHATNRVRETNWHETQVIDALSDGGCEMRIRVGSTQEMKPWIRQWGCDCEVLAPADLRREIGEEMRRAGEIYDTEEKHTK